MAEYQTNWLSMVYCFARFQFPLLNVLGVQSGTKGGPGCINYTGLPLQALPDYSYESYTAQ